MRFYLKCCTSCLNGRIIKLVEGSRNEFHTINASIGTDEVSTGNEFSGSFLVDETFLKRFPKLKYFDAPVNVEILTSPQVCDELVERKLNIFSMNMPSIQRSKGIQNNEHA